MYLCGPELRKLKGQSGFDRVSLLEAAKVITSPVCNVLIRIRFSLQIWLA